MTLVIMLSRKPNYSDQYFRNRLLLFLKHCFLLRNSTHEQFSGPCLTFPMDLLKSSRQLFFPGLFSLFSKTATMSREKTFIWQHKRVCPENGLSFIGFYSLVILGQVFFYHSKKDKWILVMQNCITKIVGWTVAWNHLAMQDLQSPKKRKKKV